MLLFLLQKKGQDELAEDLQQIQMQLLLMTGHLQRGRILQLNEIQGQEITVQDLMINQTIIIYSLFQPIPKKMFC